MRATGRPDTIREWMRLVEAKLRRLENRTISTGGGGGGGVTSVNGDTGPAVVLTASEVGAVDATTLNANTILYAVTDDTPAALPVAASRIVGRKAAGDIDDMTTAELAAIFGTPDGTKFMADDGTLKTPSGNTYSTYVPALTAVTTNPTLGTGSTQDGRYFQDGKHVVVDAAIGFGTSGVAAGSGAYRFSLPVAQRTPTSFEGFLVGQGYLFDNSTGAVRAVMATRITSTTVQLFVADGSAAVTNAVPWTWAASDVLIMHFDYEAA